MSVFNPIPGATGGLPNWLLWGGPLFIGAYAGIKLSQWYGEYKNLPDNADISSWAWYKKVAVGWIIKGEGFVDALKTQWDAKVKEEQRVYSSGDVGKIVKYNTWRTINSLPPFVFANMINGTVNWLKHEWERDQWDGFWKTVGIVAGVAATIVGIAAAPVTGGGSLALTALGIAMIASGVAVGVKESYEYTEAKTKKELDRDAKDDVDEILYVPMTIISGGGTFKIGRISSLTKKDVDFYVELEEPKIAPSGKKFRYVGGIKTTEGTEIIETAATDGRYYVENIYYKKVLTKAGKLGLEAHEAYGEAAIEKGIVKLPPWVESLENRDKGLYSLLRDISADKAAARFVGREAVVQSSGINWWHPPKEGYTIYKTLNGEVVIDKTLPRYGEIMLGLKPLKRLDQTTISNYLKETEVPYWYSPWTPGVSFGTSLTIGTISNGSTSMDQSNTLV